MEKLAKVIKNFLKYSFEPIEFKYDDLTQNEKAQCTREEFEELVAWIKAE
jgi:hypothetical protein